MLCPASTRYVTEVDRGWTEVDVVQKWTDNGTMSVHF